MQESKNGSHCKVRGRVENSITFTLEELNSVVLDEANLRAIREEVDKCSSMLSSAQTDTDLLVNDRVEPSPVESEFSLYSLYTRDQLIVELEALRLKNAELLQEKDDLKSIGTVNFWALPKKDRNEIVSIAYSLYMSRKQTDTKDTEQESQPPKIQGNYLKGALYLIKVYPRNRMNKKGVILYKIGRTGEADSNRLSCYGNFRSDLRYITE